MPCIMMKLDRLVHNFCCGLPRFYELVLVLLVTIRLLEQLKVSAPRRVTSIAWRNYSFRTFGIFRVGFNASEKRRYVKVRRIPSFTRR